MKRNGSISFNKQETHEMISDFLEKHRQGTIGESMKISSQDDLQFLTVESEETVLGKQTRKTKCPQRRAIPQSKLDLILSNLIHCCDKNENGDFCTTKDIAQHLGEEGHLEEEGTLSGLDKNTKKKGSGLAALLSVCLNRLKEEGVATVECPGHGPGKFNRWGYVR